MSDLQISLLIIGAVVVAGVYLFNWFQERRFRRRLGAAFDEERPDVLLEPAEAPVGRVEPQLSWTGTGTLPDEAREAQPAATADLPPSFDADSEYVAVIDGVAAIPQAALDEVLTRLTACGKPCRAAVLRTAAGAWQEAVRGGADHYVKAAFALQLVNRSGSVTAAQLAMFCDAVRNGAARVSAVAACPDTQAALKRARELDAFCSEVDIAIGVNIVAADGQTFTGQRIRSLAEAAGFKLEPDGLFHFRNDERHTLFTIDNHEPAPFFPEQVNRITTTGVTLLLDVPRVADGPAALDRMLELGRGLARALGGRLVDDNRVPLNEAGVARIRQQLADISSRMAAFGIEAGGPRALRLFS
jgi:hypothetical protein